MQKIHNFSLARLAQSWNTILKRDRHLDHPSGLGRLSMRSTTSRRRRIGIVVAVLLPLGILVQGLSQVDAQFPKGGGAPQPPVPPGFNPPGQNPPGFNPPGPGGNPPKGPKQPFGGKMTYEWRCSKCKAVIATTNTPFNPGVSDCPRCGVHFINGGGGKGGLMPPPNLPMNGNNGPGGAAPPNGNGPPAGFQPPNGPAPGFQPNPPPAGFQPPAGPPLGAAPPNAPPADVAPPNAPLAPVAAPDNAAVQVAANDCQWCSGAVAGDSRYCTGCKLKMGGVVLGGTIVVLGLVIIPVGLLGWFLLRSGGR
jgi:hypothetical protein